MKRLRLLVVVTGLSGLGLVVLLAAPSLSGQSAGRDTPRVMSGEIRSFWAGGRLGVSVRDLEDADNQTGGGAYVEDVRPDRPAAKAGMLRGDIITRFDGEAVRSVRQLTRLVQEAAPGRPVTATVVREGKPTDLSLVPESGYPARMFSEPSFSFDGDFRGVLGRSRLGVTLGELPPQLADYFGAKDGVLVSSVVEDSPASRAGLKAGDVIVSVNGRNVSSPGDLVRELRSAGAAADVTIGIVRDKKEASVKARLEDARAGRPARPIRSIRATPA